MFCFQHYYYKDLQTKKKLQKISKKTEKTDIIKRVFFIISNNCPLTDYLSSVCASFCYFYFFPCMSNSILIHFRRKQPADQPTALSLDPGQPRAGHSSRSCQCCHSGQQARKLPAKRCGCVNCSPTEEFGCNGSSRWAGNAYYNQYGKYYALWFDCRPHGLNGICESSPQSTACCRKQSTNSPGWSTTAWFDTVSE